METSDRPRAHYDLHLHSFCSYDATARVEDHFKRTRELGVRCIAITDHHVLDAACPAASLTQDRSSVSSSSAP
ncbi:MAG TPA: PHP domain-containing protein [Candidatus Latescibacteria bacterium]|nr:PHP domain-containing protein [Candidatus Latescibacterota bacterium]